MDIKRIVIQSNNLTYTCLNCGAPLNLYLIVTYCNVVRLISIFQKLLAKYSAISDELIYRYKLIFNKTIL